MWSKERGSKSNEHKQERQFGNGHASSLSLLRFIIFFSLFHTKLFFKAVWSPWLFQSVGVVVVWNGCHHAAGKTGGAAAVPASENSQAEGNKTIVSGDHREKTSAKSLRHHESGFRGYHWRLLLSPCCVMVSSPAALYFVLFSNEVF